MKLSDDLQRALRQVAEQEDSTPPHEFSQAHEQRMKSLFNQKTVPNVRWLRAVLSLAACLAIIALVGWQAGWWMPEMDAAPPTEDEPGATTTTTYADAGDAVNSYGDQNTDGASPGNTSQQVCRFIEWVTVTAVGDTYFVAVPTDQIHNEFADVAVTEFIVQTTDTTDYTVGDQLTIQWKADDCQLEGTRCYVTPYEIHKEV